MKAVTGNNMKEIESCLKQGIDIKGETALIKTGSISVGESLNYLLDRGIDINRVDEGRITAIKKQQQKSKLIYLKYYYQGEVIQVIVENKESLLMKTILVIY